MVWFLKKPFVPLGRWKRSTKTQTNTIMINLNFAKATNSQIQDFSIFLNEKASVDTVDAWEAMMIAESNHFLEEENDIMLDYFRQVAIANKQAELVRCMEAFFPSHI